MAKSDKENTQDVNKEKLKALKLAMDKIDKDYGKGTIMQLGSQAVIDIPAISRCQSAVACLRRQ